MHVEVGGRRPPGALESPLDLVRRERDSLARALRESEARYRRLLVTEQQERAQAEAAEANLRAILAASPQPIIVLDLEGYVKSWNAAAERTLGWSAEEIIDRPLPTIPEAEQTAADSVFLELVAGATIVGMEVRRQRQDRSWIDLIISASPATLPGPGCMQRITGNDAGERGEKEIQQSNPEGVQVRAVRRWPRALRSWPPSLRP
jgi:PAS domain S-box-containing protein